MKIQAFCSEYFYHFRDYACDSYQQMDRDVELISSLNMKNYRYVLIFHFILPLKDLSCNDVQNFWNTRYYYLLGCFH